MAALENSQEPLKETKRFPFSWTGLKKTLKEIFDRTNKLNLESIGFRTGDVAIITGGARGIGAMVVQKLLQCDFQVVLGVRSAKAGEKFISELRESGVKTGIADCIEVDLKSFNSVHHFAEQVRNKYSKIHLLICNAGVMFTPFELTVDGFEVQFQVDYLSHFLLTELLLTRMIETAQTSPRAGRIVNVSSIAHWSGNIKDISDIETRHKEYNVYKAYCDAKLCQVAASNYLDNLLRTQNTNVYSYSLHPGAIPTDLGAHIVTLPSFLKKLFRTTEDGADVIVCAGASPEFESKGGIFLMNCQMETPKLQSRDTKIQAALWEKSYQLIGIDERK